MLKVYKYGFIQKKYSGAERSGGLLESLTIVRVMKEENMSILINV